MALAQQDASRSLAIGRQIHRTLESVLIVPKPKHYGRKQRQRKRLGKASSRPDDLPRSNSLRSSALFLRYNSSGYHQVRDIWIQHAEYSTQGSIQLHLDPRYSRCPDWGPQRTTRFQCPQHPLMYSGFYRDQPRWHCQDLKSGKIFQRNHVSHQPHTCL